VSILPGALIALAVIVLIVLTRSALRQSGDDPTVWERQIRGFEKEDRRRPPPAGAIVFTGSSSIRFWRSLQEDMAPLPVLNRGFGGAKIHQITHYADRIVLPYRPSAIVFYGGENDVVDALASKKKTPDQVRDAYRSFCQRVRSELPGVPIYFISIKPPTVPRDSWPAMQRTNELVREYCASEPRLYFIDVVAAMSDGDGRSRRDLFRWDGRHLNDKGYALWTSAVKPVLEASPM
jgi:lysophospholipase L1-like esterase